MTFKRCVFSEYKRVLSDQIEPRLTELFAKDRIIILVIYGGYRNLCFLRATEIDLKPIFTIDTQ